MKDNAIITNLVNDIVKSCEPIKIFLISNKFNTKRELTSFKLCIIASDFYNTAELEGQLYLNTDCPIPFDILIYNFSQWEGLIHDYDTFAAKINRTGVVLYGEE